MTGLDRFRFWVATAIVVAWLLSLIAAGAIDGFHIEPTVNILAMGVAGWLFGPAITGRRERNGDGS